MNDLQKGLEGNHDLQPYIEPFLSFMAVVELRALARAVQEGQPISPDQMIAAVVTALPPLVATFTNLRDAVENPIPEDIDPDDLPPGLQTLVQDMATALQPLITPLQVMEEVQQYLAVGDELAAAVGHDPLASLFAGMVLDSNMGSLGMRMMEQANQLNAAVPEMAGFLAPLAEFGTRRANAEVTTAREKLTDARIDFIDTARQAISS
ncbi:hypothetical protein [Streptomyces chartreusis]|uniref:hypothetical protein n=1 Tax=Streptomyces chartreusis TaxID=1969 RepID=UPI0037FE6358